MKKTYISEEEQLRLNNIDSDMTSKPVATISEEKQLKINHIDNDMTRGPISTKDTRKAFNASLAIFKAHEKNEKNMAPIMVKPQRER